MNLKKSLFSYIEYGDNFSHDTDKQFDSLCSGHQEEITQKQIFSARVVQQCEMLTPE